MKINATIRLLIILIIFVPELAFGQKASNEKSLFKLGVSQINITPEVPLLMDGYEARTTSSTGVHDSLYATALFFTGENTEVLLITSEIVGFYVPGFIDDTKKMISAKTGVPSDNIMISAVHSHGGPTLEYSKPGPAYDYTNSLKEKFVQVAVASSKKVMPFKMGIGKGSFNMNINRRALMSNGSISLGRNPDGACDRELDVIKFEDLNNNLMAVLINWPCHATTMGAENYKITGDWPGAAARYIKKEVGQDVVVGVTVGASANINPIYSRNTNFTETEAFGSLLAKEACKTLGQISTSPIKHLQGAYTTMTFPGKQMGKNNLPTTTYEKGPDVELRLSALKIGDLVLSGISGELMTEIGMAVKKQSPFSNTIIVTHCNGASGYICTDESFSIGGYENMSTYLMPGVEKPLIQKFLELINGF